MEQNTRRGGYHVLRYLRDEIYRETGIEDHVIGMRLRMQCENDNIRDARAEQADRQHAAKIFGVSQ
jgi:translation initiation factor IF-1